MKNYIKYKLLVFLLISIYSCKKEKDNTITPPTNNNQIQIDSANYQLNVIDSIENTTQNAFNFYIHYDSISYFSNNKEIKIGYQYSNNLGMMFGSDKLTTKFSYIIKIPKVKTNDSILVKTYYKYSFEHDDASAMKLDEEMIINGTAFRPFNSKTFNSTGLVKSMYIKN